MIVDRHDPLNLFALLPELRLKMEPELKELDTLLEDDVILGRVRADLSRRRPNSATLGRRSTPVEVILRMLVVRRLYDWSYEECERFVSDSITLRQFCRLFLEPAPDDTTLIRWANLIGPETLEELNGHVVEPTVGSHAYRPGHEPQRTPFLAVDARAVGFSTRGAQAGPSPFVRRPVSVAGGHARTSGEGADRSGEVLYL